MIRILIIDHDTAFVDKMVYMLKSSNDDLELSVAYNIEDALSASAKQIFDIVVIDIRLPEMQELSIIDIIKKNCDTTAVIATSSCGATKDCMEAAFNHGSIFYIEKPYSFEKLEHLINLSSKKRRATPNKPKQFTANSTDLLH